MGALKKLSQSWFSAGIILCLVLSGLFYLLGARSAGVLEGSGHIFTVIKIMAIFVLPSTILNWLYDIQGHLQTQRHWMKAPKGLIGKTGYILTGSIALWALLWFAIGLGALVMVGLFSLGQAAWST